VPPAGLTDFYCLAARYRLRKLNALSASPAATGFKPSVADEIELFVALDKLDNRPALSRFTLDR
jgi:hypothetical protein